jgi:hypothetical protein
MAPEVQEEVFEATTNTPIVVSWELGFVVVGPQTAPAPPESGNSSTAVPKPPLSHGDAHGHAPLFSRPVVTFLPSRHRNKAGRSINRRGITGLVGFAVPLIPIRAPLDRFRVGLVAEISARENFKNTKTSKTTQISLGPRENLLGRAGLVL